MLSRNYTKNSYGKYSIYAKKATNKKLNKKTKTNFVKCYVWSVLLYSCKTWTIDEKDKKKLETMEI